MFFKFAGKTLVTNPSIKQMAALFTSDIKAVGENPKLMSHFISHVKDFAATSHPDTKNAILEVMGSSPNPEVAAFARIHKTVKEHTKQYGF